MSIETKLKEELTTARLFISLTVAVEVSLIAWLVENFHHAAMLMVVCALLATAGALWVLGYLVAVVLRHCKRLEVC